MNTLGCLSGLVDIDLTAVAPSARMYVYTHQSYDSGSRTIHTMHRAISRRSTLPLLHALLCLLLLHSRLDPPLPHSSPVPPFRTLDNDGLFQALLAASELFLAELFTLFVALAEGGHGGFEEGAVGCVELGELGWEDLCVFSIIEDVVRRRAERTCVENLTVPPSVTRRMTGYSRVSSTVPSGCFMAESSPSCVTKFARW